MKKEPTAAQVNAALKALGAPKKTVTLLQPPALNDPDWAAKDLAWRTQICGQPGVIVVRIAQ